MSLSENRDQGALAQAGTEPEPEPEREPEPEPELEVLKTCPECYGEFSDEDWEKEQTEIKRLVLDWADNKYPYLYDTPEEKVKMLLAKGNCSNCSSFVCSECDERKAKCEEGSKPLYEDVCIDCTRCPHCDCAMWDYECDVCLRAGR